MKVLLTAMALLVTMGTAEARKLPPPPPIPVEPVAKPTDLLHLDLSTGGSVVIAMRPDKAPNHVARVQQLTRAGFYDGITFHRVLDGFMAQTGDPLGTGAGGSSLPDLKAEFNDLPHVRGAVSMARAEGSDSANSQFFIIFMPTLRLDNRYTVFGRVQSGMQFVDAITKGEAGSGDVAAAQRSKIVHAWIEADGPNAAKVALPAAALPSAPPAAAITGPASPATAVAPVPAPTTLPPASAPAPATPPKN